MTTLNLLFSIDDDYCSHFFVTLFSIYENTCHEKIAVYVLQKEQLQQQDTIYRFCAKLGISYYPIIVGETIFTQAPTSNRYPESIYYRLLAHHYLPKHLDKILYLDADILCLNDINSLYALDLGDYLYAGASHTASANLSELVNKLRLGNYEARAYVNSGVLLMNLKQMRQDITLQEILDYINQTSSWLLLPDQDILNALYGYRIQLLPDHIYNYDTRYNVRYYTKSSGQWNLNWVIANTVFLHFCGKDKPWNTDYHGRYSALYKHYQHRAQRLLAD